MNDAFIFLLSILLITVKLTCSHTCVHSPPKIDQVEFVNLKSKGAISKRNAFNNLRIKVFYEPTVNFLPKHKLDIIQKNIIPSAANFWHQALLVRPLIVPLRLKRRCPHGSYDQKNACHINCANVTTCGEVVIPDEHLMPCKYCVKNCSMIKTKSKGIEGADFVFYISTQQTERCSRGSTVAYAAHCQQETSMDRPIAGHVNLCPNSISTKTQDIHSLLSTVKHEMLHALGFSIALYGFFRTPSGDPLTNALKSIWEFNQINTSLWPSVIKEVKRTWYVGNYKATKIVHVMTTPKVKAEVRRHFNCSSLEGAELEDQGGDGTRLTHWEKRLFENEAMTGTHTQNPIFSRLTFAMMEDTGWYRVNYTLAEPLQWGRNLGCDFAMKSCREWIIDRRKKGLSIHPYCDKLKESKNPSDCMDDRNALALCNLKKYKTPLPLMYQNFENIPNVSKNEVAYYGGSVKLADYCPYKQEFTWKSSNSRGSKCIYPENSPPTEFNFALEYYGENSKCFQHTEIWKNRNCYQIHYWEHWGSGCYKYSCDNGRVRLIIANQTFTCFYTKQEISVQISVDNLLYTGGILCPSCQEICNEKDHCHEELNFDAPNISYPKDVLECSSFQLDPKINVAIFFLIIYIFISLFMCKLI